MAKRNTYSVDESLEAPFNIKNFGKCGKYVKNAAKPLIAGLILSIASMVLSLLGPLFLKAIIDNLDGQIIAGTKDIKFILIIGIVYLLCLFISEIINYFTTISVAKAGQQIIHEIRVDIFAHIQKLSFNYFDSRPRGKILVRVVHYVNNVADFLSSGLINLVVQFLSVFIIFFFMLMLDIKLSLVILSGLPLFILYLVLIKKPQRKAWTNFSAKNSNLTAYVSESINGMQITQAFNREKTNLEIFSDLCLKLKNALVKALGFSRMVIFIIESIRVLIRALLYISAVILFANSHYEAGTVVAMASYAMRFWNPIQALGDIYNQIVNTGSYLERIFDTLDEKVEIEDAKDAYALPEIKGNVEYDNVTFAYEEDKTVLENVSFKAKAGNSYAFVGPTGAGKSTIVNLLCRFYDIQSGEIKIDGHNISKVTLSSLRSSLGIMLQDSFIFSGTIKDNIRYGKLDATDQEIIEAAKTVCAHEFISELENGYDTVINEKGSMLSQGQRQLICFARTVLSNPAILILDEATSSIDTETEQLLQMSIKKMLSGRTSFIIAHRLSTIVSCDEIMYIDNKGIAERGSHEELLKKQGLYYNLYTNQLAGNEHSEK